MLIASLILSTLLKVLGIFMLQVGYFILYGVLKHKSDCIKWFAFWLIKIRMMKYADKCFSLYIILFLMTWEVWCF